MGETPSVDRSFNAGRDANNNVIATGDGNTISVVYYLTLQATAPLAKGANPYVGLAAFGEDQADRFFGRGAQIDLLWTRYAEVIKKPLKGDAARFLAILGPSGSGKSSLARAGLLPKLRQEPVGGNYLRAIVLTPDVDPLGRLAHMLAYAATGDSAAVKKGEEFRELLAEERHGVHDGLSRIGSTIAAGGPPLLILIDQFEEVYSRRPPKPNDKHEADRRAFVETLVHAAKDPAAGVSVMITLRTDFMGQAQADNALAQLIAASNVVVPPMSPDELRGAIAEPALKADGQIDEPAIQRLVSWATGQAGALPLLQYTLVEIWKGLKARTPASVTLEALGGIGGVLGKKADAIYADLESDADRIVAQRAFLAMADVAGERPTRRRPPVRDLLTDPDIPNEVERAHVLEVLDAFANVDARLITLSAEDNSGDVTVEVAHEAIFDHWQKLKDWIEENRGDMRLRNRVADAAQLWKDGQGSLWRSPDLDALREFAKKPTTTLTDHQHAFFDASEKAVAAEAEAKAEQQRRLEAFADQMAVQRSTALATTARQAMESGDNALGLLLALEALPAGSADDPAFGDARAALQSALLNIQEVRCLGDGAMIYDMLVSPSDNRLATRDQENVCRLWDSETGALLATEPDETFPGFWEGRQLSPEQRGDFQFSADGKLLLIRKVDGSITRLDAESGRRLGAFGVGFWSPDGQLLVVGAGMDFDVRSSTTGEMLATLVDAYALPPDRGEATGIPYCFSPSGTLIATGLGPVCIWDVRPGQDGRLRIEIDTGRETVGRVDLSADDLLLTVFGSSAQIWDVRTGAPVGEALVGEDDQPLDIYFSSDGMSVYGKAGESWRVWDRSGGKRFAIGGLADILGYSSDGRQLVARRHEDAAVGLSYFDGALPTPEGVVAQPFEEGPGERFRPRNASFSADGSCIVALVERGAAVWRTGPLRRLGQVLRSPLVEWAKFSFDGRWILTKGQDGFVRIFPTPAEDEPRRLWSRDEPLEWWCAAQDERHMFTVGDDGLSIWDLATGDKRSIMGEWGQGPERELLPWALSCDCRRILFALGEQAFVGDVETGARRRLGDLEDDQELRFSPTGEHVLSMVQGGGVEVWDATTAKRIFFLDEKIKIAAFSPDGARLYLTALDQRSVQVWDVATGQELAQLADGPTRIVHLLVSPDGRTVLTVSMAAEARFWSAEDGRQLAVLDRRVNTPGLAVFSPDGRRIAVPDGDEISLYDVATGRILVSRRFGRTWANVGFAPDGFTMILADGYEGEVMTWAAEVLYGEALREAALRRRPRDFTDDERRTYGLGAPAAFARN